MISFIEGEILDIQERHTVVLVGGIGYKVFVIKQTASALALNIETQFHCYLAVRENSLDLYGFIKKEELQFFELLLTISKIGPKTALSILDAASPDTIRMAVVSGNTSELTKVSGIGKKNAEKIVLELKSKITALAGDHEAIAHNTENSDTIDALISLGYSQKEARTLSAQIPKDIETTEKKITYVLKELGK